MKTKFLKDALGWGFILWLIGYALGIMLFPFVPTSVIGWVIAPVGTVITVWVASRKVNGNSMGYYGAVALVWLVIAVVGDYLFIVKAFEPTDGYDKPDVYFYYTLTVAIPLWAGWRRTAHHG